MSRSSIYSGTRIGREMEQACDLINCNMLRAAATLTEYSEGRDKLIEALFKPDVIAKAKAARGIVRPRTEVIAYEGGYIDNGSMSVTINYEGCLSLPIENEYLSVDGHLILPLNNFAMAVREIYLRYEEVKGVLRWLNKSATLGAIRAIFPTAMQLCPDTFRGMSVPSRYDTPAGLHDWLQPIRDAGNTWAAATMLPGDSRPRVRKHVWLTFSPRVVPVGSGEQRYITDNAIFNA